MDVEFTAHVEENLDKVERAEHDWVALLREFYQGFAQQLEKTAGASLKVIEGRKCPQCGGQLYERFSVFGKFAGCENYDNPEIRCDYTEDLLEDVLPRTEPEEIGEKCPECGQKLLKRTGSHGEFIGCSGYPDCKYTRPVGSDRTEKAKRKAIATDLPCEKEGCSGHLVLRYGRRGPFLGCSNFPKCRFTRNVTDDELKQIEASAANSAGESR